jgi:predicted NBD/HSP70 family sugar kinase
MEKHGMSTPFSGDSSLLKSINKSTLLKIIRAESPISRADLAKRTKLTRATVSALVEELIRDHLVAEIGIGESSGGRKPMLLEMNRGAGCVFGIDLRANEILFVVTDLLGGRVSVTSYDYKDPLDGNLTFMQLQEIIAAEQAALPESPLGLTGVGIGIHGFVEHPGGRILFVPYHGWKNLEWKQKLEEKLQIPVFIDNEANLAALGELEFGAASGLSDMLYLSIGAGIGAGMILGGEVFRGIGGFAGEVGHTTMEREGLACTCGNLGCWEMYASEKALADRLGLKYGPGVSKQLLEMLRNEDPGALAAVKDAGISIGIGIANLVHIFNPQMVVIGNTFGKYQEWLSPHVEEAIRARILPVQKEIVQIRYSALEDQACAVGAASMVIRHLINL